MSAADAVTLETDAAEPGSAADGSGEGAPGAGGRSLSGEKAQRIVEAMRRSVARRGTAGSTFDHVSREAGVSRGLLHYYFGTKEQLLVEAPGATASCAWSCSSTSSPARRRPTTSST